MSENETKVEQSECAKAWAAGLEIRDRSIELNLRLNGLRMRRDDARRVADEALRVGKPDDKATTLAVLLDEQSASCERALQACRSDLKVVCQRIYAARLSDASASIQQVERDQEDLLRAFMPYLRGLATCAIRMGWGLPDPARDPYSFLRALASELSRNASLLTGGALSADVQNILGGANYKALVGADRQTINSRHGAAHTVKAKIEKGGTAAVEAELLGSLGQ